MKSFFTYIFSLFICMFSYGQINNSKYTGFGNIKNNYNLITSLSKYKQTTKVKLPEINKVYYNNPNFKNLNKKTILSTRVHPYFSMSYAGIRVNNYPNFTNTTTSSSYRYSTTEIVIESIFTAIDVLSFFSYY